MKVKKPNLACGTCRHYIQHYHKNEQDGTYHLVYCGHCMMPRVKKRTNDTQACEHYLNKEKK